MPQWNHRLTALPIACLIGLAALSCSSHHARPKPTATTVSPTGDVVLVVRYVELRLTTGIIDPAWGFTYPFDLAFFTRASACRAWRVSPHRNERSQVEIHLKIPAAGVTSAATLLRSRFPVLTAHAEPLSALNSSPTEYTKGIAGLPEVLKCPVRRN